MRRVRNHTRLLAIAHSHLRRGVLIEAITRLLRLEIRRHLCLVPQILKRAQREKLLSRLPQSER